VDDQTHGNYPPVLALTRLGGSGCSGRRSTFLVVIEKHEHVASLRFPGLDTFCPSLKPSRRIMALVLPARAMPPNVDKIRGAFPGRRRVVMPDDAVKNFGKQVPMKRPRQPAELATTYVMLADPMSSYVSGTTVAVTGGKPFI
jgi:hypothetical protein